MFRGQVVSLGYYKASTRPFLFLYISSPLSLSACYEAPEKESHSFIHQVFTECFLQAGYPLPSGDK